MIIEVSIIIPFFENFNFLNRALESIHAQKFKNYEIIVINDNPSNDDSFNFKKIRKKFKKLKIINNKFNIGAGLSRNKGIKYSKGKYIAFLDSDDYWQKNKLKTQINFMKKKNYFLLTHLIGY